MKQIYFLIAIFILSLNSYSQNCNIGNETKTSAFISLSLGANSLSGVKYILSQEGTLKSINLIGNNTGSGVQMAVYDDNNGVPNDLKAFSSLGTVGDGITSLPVTPTLLPAGDYWIMAVYEFIGNNSNYMIGGTAIGNDFYIEELTYGDPIPANASTFLRYSGRDHLYFLGIDCGNTLSIDDFHLTEKKSILPNPANGFITVSNLESIENFIIINELGQEVKKGVVSNQEEINIKNFANGLYFMKFDDGNTIKFIKK